MSWFRRDFLQKHARKDEQHMKFGLDSQVNFPLAKFHSWNYEPVLSDHPKGRDAGSRHRAGGGKWLKWGLGLLAACQAFLPSANDCAASRSPQGFGMGQANSQGPSGQYTDQKVCSMGWMRRHFADVRFSLLHCCPEGCHVPSPSARRLVCPGQTVGRPELTVSLLHNLGLLRGFWL